MRCIVGSILASLVACGGSSEPQGPEPGALTPIAEADVVPPGDAPPPAAKHPDLGPGELPAPIVAAYEAVFPDARRVRCRMPEGIAQGGTLAVVSLEREEHFLVAPTVRDGWFAAVVPRGEGNASMLRDDKVVARVTWPGTPNGGWQACTVTPAERFPILGVVQGPDLRPIPGATVRGCEADAVVTANEEGRFELSGVVGHPCLVTAFVQDDEGMGASEPEVVYSVRPGDVIAEIQVPPERLTTEQMAAAASDRHDLLTRVLRNTLGAELDGLTGVIERAELEGEAADIAQRWLNDLTTRYQADKARVDALKDGGADALRAYWLTEYR